MHLHRLPALLVLAGLAAAQLPKNGGLTDQRPTYPDPDSAVYKPVEPKLKSRWTDSVTGDPDNAWPEYPRPLLRRDNWSNLNGVWQFQSANSRDAVNSPPYGQTLKERILVPFCMESGISGIAQQHHYSWYRRTFQVPDSFEDRAILHFAAVDYHATVFVNGKKVGEHTGGYDKFSFDITESIKQGAENELIVFVYDPTDNFNEVIPLGKQRVNPSHIFYTPCSGIWQTVSLEAVPAEYITNIDFRASADGSIKGSISSSSDSSPVATISVLDPADNSKIVFQTNVTTNQPISVTVDPAPKLWSPEEPNLYNITVAVGSDKASTYVGFRTVERKNVSGHERMVLNGKPIFIFGPLDQGYWPDGLHSPPSYEAMVFDMDFVRKELGMNFMRKHIKVEPDLFYYAADKMGLIIMQDMPSLMIRGVNDAQQKEFERQLDIMVKAHLNYPSVLSFVIYNEGWGQRGEGPEDYLTDHLRDILGGHQLINSVSGWTDGHWSREGRSIGDFHDNHKYSSPQCGTPFSSLPSFPYDPKRIGFQGEFGGIGHNVSIENLWNDAEAIRAIPETYEIDLTLEAYNYRALRVIEELREQTEMFKNCNGGVYTQTTDVEGEVNGFLTYDRRISRVDKAKWKALVQALYDTFEKNLD